MMKLCFSAAIAAGLVLGMAASADAKGGRSGQTAGSSFTPPGFSKGNKSDNWGTSTLNNGGVSSSVSTPPGWSHQSTNPSWNTTLGGPIPPGLSKCPPGLSGC